MSSSIILVVDPDRDVADGIAIRLRNLDYDVITARNMAQGLAILGELQPHAILIDIELPEPSGLATLRDCLESAALRRIPVISLSNSHRLQRQAAIVGARAHIDKPFGTDALLAAIRVAISKSQVSEFAGRQSSDRIDETELNNHRQIKPIAESQEAAGEFERQNQHPAHESRLSNPRVLIVDDDAEIRCGAQVRLQAAGYDVIAACDGEKALRVASQYHPDAILLDVRMPCMDGLTVLCKLRERPETADIPVVMLSASIVDQRAALDAGARFFMKKPYQARGLLAAVSTAIGH